MSKSAFRRFMVLSAIDAAIELLLSENDYCTATDVLRLIPMEETKTTRSVVIERAVEKGMSVKPSGRGYRIFVEN